jgi:hypothetical protein
VATDPDDVDCAATDHRLDETMNGLCKGFLNLRREEEQEFNASFVSMLAGPSVQAVSGATKFLARLMSDRTVEPAWSSGFYITERRER